MVRFINHDPTTTLQAKINIIIDLNRPPSSVNIRETLPLLPFPRVRLLSINTLSHYTSFSRQRTRPFSIRYPSLAPQTARQTTRNNNLSTDPPNPRSHLAVETSRRGQRAGPKTTDYGPLHPLTDLPDSPIPSPPRFEFRPPNPRIGKGKEKRRTEFSKAEEEERWRNS